MLLKAGVQAIDVAGAGGTNWVKIDAMRGKNSNAEAFYEWGIPTAAAVMEARSVFSKTIIASGGIRSGMDVVKALVIGADLSAMAMPILRAQDKGGKKGVIEWLTRVREEIRTTMFLVGAKNVHELKEKKAVIGGKLKEWVKQRAT